MITLPELAAQDLGSFLASDTKDRFGSSHARLAEIIPFAARLALDCIGNSDALYHNVEHTMLVTLAGHEIYKGRTLLMPSSPTGMIVTSKPSASRLITTSARIPGSSSAKRMCTSERRQAAISDSGAGVIRELRPKRGFL